MAGKMLVDPQHPNYDIEKGIKYLDASPTVPAKMLLGRLYQNKERGYYSLLKAHKQFSAALESLQKKESIAFHKLPIWNKNSKAQILFYLGKIYASPDSMLFDYEKAISHLKESVALYHEIGENNNVFINQTHVMLGNIYADKNEKFFNPYAAEQNFQIALNNSLELKEQDPDNDFNSVEYVALKLNKLYMDEETVLWNLDKAMDVLKYGQEDDKGLFLLKRGDIFASEKYHSYNMGAAINCYVQAANEKGNTTAMVRIAKCYLFGLGVQRDKQEALTWLSRAADAGDEYAKEYMQNIQDMENPKFNGYTYALLRQLLSGMTQAKNNSEHKLREAEFKSQSKQAKKEQHLHRN